LPSFAILRDTSSQIYLELVAATIQYLEKRTLEKGSGNGKVDLELFYLAGGHGDNVL
jgi:hypothetical protein